MTDWALTDHACRACLGRVLVTGSPGAKRYRCAECGIEGEGRVQSICACGATLRGGKNAGFRCVRNPAVSAETPAEIVVRHLAET